MTELSQPFVIQHVLDALGRWAKRSAGVDVAHGEQEIPKATPPYISLEWIEELAHAGPKVEYEVSGAPSTATFTVTAAASGWTAIVVNNARANLEREADETLTLFSDRVAATLRSNLSGRTTVTRAGAAGVIVTTVKAGDLYRAAVLEGATLVTAGSNNARIVERIYRGTVRVWCIGAVRTSGQAGVAGTGLTTSELLAALMEGLDRPWCRELFDSFLIRRTGETTAAPARGRRKGPARESRSFFDLPLGVTARFALASEAAISVPFALTTLETPDPDEPADLLLTAPNGDTLEI